MTGRERLGVEVGGHGTRRGIRRAGTGRQMSEVRGVDAGAWTGAEWDERRVTGLKDDWIGWNYYRWLLLAVGMYVVVIGTAIWFR